MRFPPFRSRAHDPRVLAGARKHLRKFSLDGLSLRFWSIRTPKVPYRNYLVIFPQVFRILPPSTARRPDRIANSLPSCSRDISCFHITARSYRDVSCSASDGDPVLVIMSAFRLPLPRRRHRQMIQLSARAEAAFNCRLGNLGSGACDMLDGPTFSDRIWLPATPCLPRSDKCICHSSARPFVPFVTLRQSKLNRCRGTIVCRSGHYGATTLQTERWGQTFAYFMSCWLFDESGTCR